MIYSRKQIFNIIDIPRYEQVAQNSASLKQLIHFGQIVNRSEFQKFDYDEYDSDLNMEKYGQAEPPVIPV